MEFSYSLNQILGAAKQVLAFNLSTRIFLFNGAMGAGKTSLIKQICALLEVDDTASSPTYSIVNEYNGANCKVFHIDLYRLNNLNDALQIGIEEYLQANNNYCFIEWAAIIEPLIEQAVVVNVDIVNKNTRRIKLSMFCLS